MVSTNCQVVHPGKMKVFAMISHPWSGYLKLLKYKCNWYIPTQIFIYKSFLFLDN